MNPRLDASATRPIRVAQLITHLARGGAQATVMGSLENPVPEIEMTLIAGLDDTGEGAFWEDERLQSTRVVRADTLSRRLHPIKDVMFLVWLIRWLRSERPDVLHTHSSKPGVLGRLAGRLAGVPVVHTVHGWSFASLTGVPRKLVIVLERALTPFSAKLVVVTTIDAETGLAERIGTPELYSIVRSGIDLETPRQAIAQRDTLRNELGLKSTDFVVGTVARLSRQKQLADLLTGFARSDIADQGARLCIIGDGPDRQELEELTAGLGLRDSVIFAGARANAASLVACFDVFALTSAWEGLPRTLIEAMAARVPVIATPVGGIEEVLEDGQTGAIIAVGDTESLADELRTAHARVVPDAEQLDRAEDAVRGFGADEMTRSLRALWTDVAGCSTAKRNVVDIGAAR